HMIALPSLVALGLAIYTASFTLLAISKTTVTIVGIAGCLIALGYSIVYPTTTEWTARHLPVEEGSRSVALIGTCFNCGSIISVQTFGFLLPVCGLRPILLAFSAIMVMVLVAVLLSAVREYAISRPAQSP